MKAECIHMGIWDTPQQGLHLYAPAGPYGIWFWHLSLFISLLVDRATSLRMSRSPAHTRICQHLRRALIRSQPPPVLNERFRALAVRTLCGK